MKILYKLFHQDPGSREGVIAMTSGVGILTNILIAAAKVIIGILSSSIAIISEGVNNITDVFTLVLAIIGAKLAARHPDEKHPFGYGRVEYLASLIISTLIIVTGAEMMISSVKLIFEPAELNISYLSVAIVGIAAVVKFFLGIYTIRMGKQVDSHSLIGVGLECRNDSFASVITIASSLIFVFFHYSIDAYVGILVSFLILKAGAGVLKETVDDLIGRPGEYELASKLYKEIRGTEGIITAVDMMLHNYGPESWSGSVNVEIDHKKTVGEIYQMLHALQLRIMYEYNVVMIFGVYAVDNDHEEIRRLRACIADFVKGEEHVKSYHAVFIDSEADRIYCDFIVDYKLRDWDALKEKYVTYMSEKYPEFQVELTIETEFV